MEALKMVAPGEGMKTEKMPGHWVLARLGKRVLRPGGMELTKRMLAALRIQATDDVVEFAPGMGITARLTIHASPHSYTAVERDEAAANVVRSYLHGERYRVVKGSAAETGLHGSSATVVYGEAMLTMQTAETKRAIVKEAYRLLKVEGRYGIHEMCLLSEVDEISKRETERALTNVVHHGVKPLSIPEWRSLLASEGFEIQTVATAPMGLLNPVRLFRDEGFAGALRFIFNLLRDTEARARVLEMRRTFHRYRKQIGAVTIVASKCEQLTNLVN